METKVFEAPGDSIESLSQRGTGDNSGGESSNPHFPEKGLTDRTTVEGGAEFVAPTNFAP